ncbi:MAG: hypothetical protein ACTS9Y_13400 [Methylophilus sp.]|uniref:hypothetical protein n=1 Tax=Methylophilus sp. TaxID=29541 RepID=UPI003F9EE03F
MAAWMAAIPAMVNGAVEASKAPAIGGNMPQYHTMFGSGDWNVATSGSKVNGSTQWYVYALGAAVAIIAVKRFTRK